MPVTMDKESEEARKRKVRNEMIEKIPMMAFAGLIVLCQYLLLQIRSIQGPEETKT